MTRKKINQLKSHKIGNFFPVIIFFCFKLQYCIMMKKTDEIEKIKNYQNHPNFFSDVKSLIFSKFSCSLKKAKRQELTAFSYKTKNFKKNKGFVTVSFDCSLDKK